MSATAARGTPADALPGEGNEQVHDDGPDGRAPEDADDQVDVRLHGAWSGSRGHAATVLFLLGLVEATWLAALLYAAYILLT